MNEKTDVREAVIRVLVEAEPEGVPDEDVLQAVEYYVEADQAQVDDVLGELFAIDLIERDHTGAPWRLVGCPS